MKKISLKGISESLTQRELRNIKGGSGDASLVTCTYADESISCYGSCEDYRGTDGVVCGVECVPDGGPADGGGVIAVGCMN